jgi:hypothetical protein
VQRFTAPPDIGLRPSAAPVGGAVAQGRASDVLPVGPAIGDRGRRNWAVALVSTVARTSWLAAVLTAAFLAGAFGATLIAGHAVGDVAPWILMGSGVWLAISLLLSVLRRR